MGNKSNKNRQQRHKKARQRLQAKRKQVSDAIHHAVCKITDSDGMGHSLLYGVCGSFFASRALEQEYIPQAGTLVINSDPDSDLSTAISADRERFVDGQFHCWFISGTKSNEFVDLSSRHYKKQVDALALLPCRMYDDPTAEVPVDDDKKPLWRRKENPPDFVWVDDGDFPELVRAIPDVSACEFLADRMKSHKERIFAVLEIARARYEKATGSKMR